MNPFFCSESEIDEVLSENITYWLNDGLENFHEFYRRIHPSISIVICSIGTILNTAIILVLTRQSMIGPINTLLCSIAICDLIVMISNSVFVSHFLILAPSRYEPSDFSYAWAIFMLIHAHTSVISHSTSLWITVALAHVRVFSVKRASKGSAQEWLPTNRAVKLSFLLLIVVVFFNTPNFMAFAIEGFPGGTISPLRSDVNGNYSTGRPNNYLETNITSDGGKAESLDGAEEFIYFPVPSKKGKNNNCFLLKLSFWMNGMIFKLLPCIFLTVFIVVLLRILNSVRLRNRNLSVESHLRHQNFVSDRTTSMLVAVLTIFLVTELPQGTLSVLTGVFSGSFRYFVYRRLGDFMDLLSLINSSVNFFIYCSMSAKFREVFCTMFCPSCFSRRLTRNRPRSADVKLVVSPNREAVIEEASSMCHMDARQLTATTNLIGNVSAHRGSIFGNTLSSVKTTYNL